jgi:energy-coupling factor transport system ATP-binding protein
VIAQKEHPGITFDDVSFAYRDESESILRHVDWEIEAGSFVVVAGASGSGKSTLLRCLNGLVPHFSGGRFGGSVSINGMDTRRHQTRALSQAVGFVFQEPDAQRVATIVEDELAFGMEQLGIPRSTMRKRVEEVLDVSGIAQLRDREIETLSGGERQRVAVAAALALQPKTLVLDEPTSQLDPWGADEVITALERLNQEMGLTVVVAEHRLERVLGVADRMRALLPTGQIDGTPGEVVPMLDVEMVPPVVRLGKRLDWRPLPLTLKAARSFVHSQRIQPSKPPPVGSSKAGSRIVSIRGLDVTLGKYRALRDFSLDVHEGEVVAVIGRNGSGKTTLLRAIMGFQKIARGAISVNGTDVVNSDPSMIARHVGYLPQRPGSVLFNETLAAELAFTLLYKPNGVAPDEILRRLDLADLAGRNPRDLSVGEQERAALAAVLVGNPSILLLDEPTRGMDARRKRALSSILTERSTNGGTTLLVTHDVELVAETATRVVLLGAGEIVADGSPRDVLAGSLSYTTQINKLFGGTFLTVDDVLNGLDI